MNDNEWLISRKAFVKTLLLSGVAMQLPWLSACSTELDRIGETNPLSEDQFRCLRSINDNLFPDDGNGPSARDINATEYMVWVLNDERLDPDEQAYFIDKLDEFINQCNLEYNSLFYEISGNDQRIFIDKIAELSWGERWLSKLLTFIFEALLLDPAYGGNSNEVGWNWLNHNPGQPRPHKEIRYPEIFEKL